jgi:hypothetical protein
MRSSQPVTITITVIDVNDNAPAFPMSVYTAQVAANGPRPRDIIAVCEH